MLTKERFLSRDQQLCEFMRTEEIVYITMAAVSLFWNTNMAALTSCETLYRDKSWQTNIPLVPVPNITQSFG